MINTSKSIVITCGDENQLRQAITDATENVQQLHEMLHGKYVAGSRKARAGQFGFLRWYKQNFRRASIECPRRTLENLMSASLLSSRDRTAQPIADAYGVDVGVPAYQLASVFRGVAATLLYLWKSGYVVLNPYFAPNLKANEHSHFKPKPLDDFICYIIDSGRYTKADVGNVWKHGKRLFWATDWINWDRFNPEELAHLHARWLEAQRKKKAGVKADYPIPPIPFRILLQSLRGGLGEKVGVSKVRLEPYQQMLKAAASDLYKSNHSDADSSRVKSFSIFHDWSTRCSRDREETAVRDYLCTIRQSLSEQRWPGAIMPRELWEDLPLRESGSQWAALFDQYLEYWGERYESDKKYELLRHFNDYLFLYLNWWHYRYGENSFAFPSTPGDIRRFVHIKKGVSSSVNPQPKAFRGFLKLRGSSKVQIASAMRAVSDFFEWLIEEFEGTSEQPKLFPAGFKNPIRANDIHYRNANKRSHARIRLSKRHAVLFADYLLAVEAFYRKLEKDASLGVGAPLPNRPLPCAIEASQYGFVPVVVSNGRVMPIDCVPVLYHQHAAALCADFSTSIQVPNLSAIRLLCIMMETGLRGAHIRWLDRKSFDLQEEHQKFPCKKIWINTDKAGDAFSVPVSDEAYHLLLAQRDAVNKVLGDVSPPPSPYMGRNNSRFEDVETLFYASSATRIRFNPINDDAYRRIFRVALASYAHWLSQSTGEEVDLVRTSDGSALSELLAGSRNEAQAAIESAHTPHSIRSTIISERISVLPIRLVGQLAGQRNVATTAYYHQLDEEHLYRVLNERPMEPSLHFGFHSNDPSYIHTGQPSSSLASALRESRQEAEVAFGLTSISFGAGYMDRGKSGLQVLRDATDIEIGFFETNLCPFSGRCPKDVVEEIGESHRCGLCRYAVKSIDQLPAIQAKIHFLEERSSRFSKESERLFKRGSSDEAQRFSDMADLDAAETVGWYLAEAVLEEKLSALRSGEVDVGSFHVDQPEILKRRLGKLPLPDSRVARLLLRISEANAYPSMQDEVVKQLAARLKRRIRNSDEPLFKYDSDPVGELCSYLATRMDVEGITTEDIVQQLESHQESIALKIDNATPLKQLVRSED